MGSYFSGFYTQKASSSLYLRNYALMRVENNQPILDFEANIINTDRHPLFYLTAAVGCAAIGFFCWHIKGRDIRPDNINFSKFIGPALLFIAGGGLGIFSLMQNTYTHPSAWAFNFKV